MTRVYVPATITELAQWHAASTIPVDAFTSAFEAPDETEEGEYAALMSAVEASAERMNGPGRRVVLVVESTAAAPVPFREVLAVHADVVDRRADADPDEDVGWFGVQEIPSLLG